MYKPIPRKVSSNEGVQEFVQHILFLLIPQKQLVAFGEIMVQEKSNTYFTGPDFLFTF